MGKDSKYYQTSEFKKLNAKWAKKLEESGFEDAEQPTDFKSGLPDGNLKQWALWLSAPSKLDPAKYQETQEYYRLAGQFLHEYKFGHPYEMDLWAMHSDGHSIDTIVASFKAKLIDRMMGRKINRRYVFETIKKLSTLMLDKLKP